MRKLATAGEPEVSRLHARMTVSQQAAAGLLAITVICMAAARYV